jgi:hypothetical protein
LLHAEGYLKRLRESATKANPGSSVGHVAAKQIIIIVITEFNSLLFMCQVNSYKANYRYNTVQIRITTNGHTHHKVKSKLQEHIIAVKQINKQR